MIGLDHINQDNLYTREIGQHINTCICFPLH